MSRVPTCRHSCLEPSDDGHYAFQKGEILRTSKQSKDGVDPDLTAVDNDNNTLRKVPHPSNQGLALQARVKVS